MDYSTIMNLWMYDFQNILERYSKMVEERKEEEKKQNEEYEKKYNPDKFLRQASGNSSIPKVPNAPNFSKVKL